MRGLLRSFLGAYLANAAYDLTRRLHRRYGFWRTLLIAASPVLLLALYVWWQTATVEDRAQAGVFALIGVAVWLWARDRWGTRRPAAVQPTIIRRPNSDLWWVYALGEYRDKNNRIVPRNEIASRRDITYHFVYCGYTADWEQRIRQHRSDKMWWHENLVIDPRSWWFTDADEALRYESTVIRDAALSERPNEWPRENQQHNRRYAQDARRREMLNARVYA